MAPGRGNRARWALPVWRNPLKAVLWVLGLTVLAYLPVLLGGQFVYEDAALRAWLCDSSWPRLSNYSPQGFHAVSLAVHLVNGLLVYRIVRVLAPTADAVVALGLFLLLPIQTEAVAYISNLWELLQTTGILLAVLGMIERPDWMGILVILGAWMAFTMKPNGFVVIPILIWTVWVLRPRSYLLVVVPVLALAVFLVVYGQHGLGVWQAVRSDPQFRQATTTWVTWTEHQSAIVVRYLALTVWPHGLSLDHDWANLTAVEGRWAELAGLLAGFLALVYHRRYHVVSWAVGLVIISVSLRVVVPTTEPLHEHALYVGLIGLSTLGGYLYAAVSARMRQRILWRPHGSAVATERV